MSAIVAGRTSECAQRAERMLALWSVLAMQHVALGSACACGMGGISLRLDDFELDIVDYLQDAGLRCGIAEVQVFFQLRQAAAESGSVMGKKRARPLVDLLERAERNVLPMAVAEWLLPRVERTLNSYAEQHVQGARADGQPGE